MATLAEGELLLLHEGKRRLGGRPLTHAEVGRMSQADADLYQAIGRSDAKAVLRYLRQQLERLVNVGFSRHGSQALMKAAVIWCRVTLSKEQLDAKTAGHSEFSAGFIKWLRQLAFCNQNISFPLSDLRQNSPLPVGSSLTGEPGDFQLEIPKANRAIDNLWLAWKALDACLRDQRIGRPKGASKLTPSVVALIKRYKNVGRPVAWIAQKMKLSRQSVYTALKSSVNS
jgi:hypothetical protein